MQLDELIVLLATVVASTETFAVILVVLSIYVLWKKSVVEGLLLMGSSLLLAVSVLSLKSFFAVARPLDALIEIGGYAFPSGHASGVMFLAFVLDWYFLQVVKMSKYIPVRIVLICGVLLVGYSRLYLHVHTFEQVIAGFLVGAAIGSVFQYLVYRIALNSKSGV